MIFENVDPALSLQDQLQIDHPGPVTLIATYVGEPEQTDAMIDGWAKRAQMMQGQPGFISSQLHRAIGGNVLVNYAVWESMDAFRAAAAKAAAGPSFMPSDAVARVIIVEKIGVPGSAAG